MEKLSTMVPGTASSVLPLPPADVVYHKGPYNPDKDALRDITGLRHALDLFLASHMVESENFCKEMDPVK